MERFADLKMPIATRRNGTIGNVQQMSRREPPYLAIDSSLDIEAEACRQEIGDPLFVVVAVDEPGRQWRRDDPVERIAGD